MRRRGVMALLAGAAVLLSGCGIIWEEPDETYRYRMTVEVDTPQGLKSGSSVIEVTMRYSIGIPQSGLYKKVTGEAVAVDLPDGRTLFALLDQADRIVPLGFKSIVPQRRMLEDEEWWQPDFEQIRMIKTRHDRVVIPIIEVPGFAERTIHPTLVTFRDPKDAESVEQLDPNALDKVLGEGVKLKQITVQITDEPVTTGIDKRLAGLGIIPGYNLDKDFPMTATPTLAQILSYRDFRKENES